MSPSYYLVPNKPPAAGPSPQAHLCQLVELLEHSAHILSKLLRRAVGGRQLLLEAGADQGQVQGATRLILQEIHRMKMRPDHPCPCPTPKSQDSPGRN